MQLCCYSFFPHIFQPTRLTTNSSTIIDNIFSYNIQDEIISGNILLALSEHFSQSDKRKEIDIKKVNIYQRDYSTFSNESFRDVSIQRWIYSYENVHESLKDFYTKLEGCVNGNAPLKKPTPIEINPKMQTLDKSGNTQIEYT